MPTMPPVEVRPTDLSQPQQAAAWLDLLDHYARDPMGGGSGLDPAVRQALVPALAGVPHFHSALAWQGDETVGLINCFAGFSTFAARPLLNIHDIAVRDARRGAGIGQVLLAWAEGRARELGCCKLTLEVLSNNRRALVAYERAGFAPYVLDPAAGQALFLQKLL
ncbi:GNAT family N-acetyltransferase [Azospira sp. I09]|uniref:GNAT family N-acetyltransferase n=1 Tax=Azospira sp. I09 TaxID=1765049 RepID=UPI0012A1EE01|nr:GNAT family N-acetyltransferase [Azospira sp. I09]BBN88848.1 N-acetyltransferase [Azospira sp. I09]